MAERRDIGAPGDDAIAGGDGDRSTRQRPRARMVRRARYAPVLKRAPEPQARANAQSTTRST